MKTNADITTYHFNDDEERYIRTYFPAVSLKEDIAVVSDKTGLKYDRIIKIRIPTKQKPEVSVGDLVCRGNGPDIPDRKACFTVTLTADNRRGSDNMHHQRIVCK